jgi:hypothetical protein
MAAPVEPAWRFYETVAASQTAQILGTTGAKGDKIARIVYVPATTAAGVVTLLDGSTSIPIFVGGGTTALIDLRPQVVELNMTALSDGGWRITTGANVSVIAIGEFT